MPTYTKTFIETVWDLETQSITQLRNLDTNVCQVTHGHTMPLAKKRAQEDTQFSQIKTATNFLPYDLFT